ncbi:hypothetical protein EXIGLDRAFT_736274 [Exidia glandulosa HHB12029]|uniref:Uncharacterized protein n=1 Tax=Exidia glandulosa HHB12029 TaxID=1314781 RepID=A0A165JHN1_EXIGL|nr:hypothetical protein EXIGLDRAFT_736274 [Exidia glandulosa HHB12029]
MGDSNPPTVPRLTLYNGKEREPPLFSQFPDAFLSQPPLGAQWLEPLDVAPRCLDASRLSAVHHGHPRPLSWPSILPHCLDHMPGTSESVLDFRTAADLVRDYDVPALQCDDEDDADDEDEDDEALVTPHRDRPPTPFGLEFALRSAWSDSESEFVNVDADLDVDASACSAMDDSAHNNLLVFPSASAKENCSLVSLSLWPSPPGSPTFSEQFAVGRTVFPYPAPSTPTRTRRLARSPSPLFYSEDPESPSLRTARNRRETMARLEGRIAANRT